jgi:U5 small nuclear ribonucleoprotein component
MMSFPEMIRNIAVVGHLHHGKTALVDMLVFETHKLDWNADTQARLPSHRFRPLRYIDAV